MTSEEIRKIIQVNLKTFSDILNEVLKDNQSWSMESPKDFIHNLMGQSSVQTQNLFSSYVTMNASVSDKQLSSNLDVWLNNLTDSTIVNMLLVLSLIDFNNEKSKTNLYTVLYEFLNIAGVGSKPTLH